MKQGGQAGPVAARLAMARWPNVRSNRWCRRKRISLCHSRFQRDHGVQRLDLDGQRVRRHARTDGCRRADDGLVAGISIGLFTEAGDDGQLKRYELLTDIIGSEDHYGDMDFKLCGTDAGVTGFQLDLKLRGVGHNIMTEAIQRAKEARTKILEIMRSTLDQPRNELSKYAPRIETIKINPEKIGALIGPGGKTIKGIVAETGAEINIEDDGTVHIYATTGESMARAKEIIGGMTREIEIGKTYQGRVVTTKEFGAFVEVFPGKDGLVHISELADFRVKRTEDVVKIGDMIWVKCIGIDEKGRVKLSRKAALKERAEKETGQALEPIAERDVPNGPL